MNKSAALITVNPTVDVLFQGEDFSFNQKIFAKHSCIAVGGSAVNIARGLQALGQSFKLYTIIGGNIGRLAYVLLVKGEIPFCFTQNSKETRLTAIWGRDRQRRMLVTPSPKIDSASLRKFINQHYQEIAKHDIVLIGGSVPEESSEYLVWNMVRPLIKQGTKVIIDSRGLFAKKTYKEVPYVAMYNREVRLNPHQHAQRVNRRFCGAHDLYKKGISLVIYNTNKYSYAIYENHIWRYPNPTQVTMRIYGRGDAFLAGLVSALLDNCSFDEAVRFAIICRASFTRDFPLGEISCELIPNYRRNIQSDAKWRIL